MDGENMVITNLSDLDRIIRNAVREEIARFQGEAKAGSPHNPEYYNTNELAELLSIDRTTIWTWEKKGLLKCKRVGRRKLYSRKEINDLINSGKRSRYSRV